MKITAKYSLLAKMCLGLATLTLLLAGCSGASSTTSDAGGASSGGGGGGGGGTSSGATTGVATPSKVSIVNTN